MGERKRTILVVDDVPEEIAILGEILKDEYRIKAVTNGELALKIARADPPPDLILLDVMMPDMDGFEVCRGLKEDSVGATIPVIFLTGKGRAADERLGLELGAVDYIRKPVDPSIVKSRVKSHLEQKDRILRASEVRFRRLFEASADGIMIVDAQTGVVLDANPALASMVGLSLEAFLGRRLEDLEVLGPVLSTSAQLVAAQADRRLRHRDLPLETADGRRIFVELVGGAYRVDGREVIQLSARETTDLVEAERERDLLSARLAHYLGTSPAVTYSLELKGGVAKWLWVSENVETVLGYTSEEALAPDWWFRNVNAVDRGKAIGIISDLALRESGSREYRFTKKDRSVVWLHDEMRLLPAPGGETEIVGTLTDVTARKKAEEEIHLKSAALEAAANAVVITDREGAIRWANPAFSALTGYALDEALGRNPRDLLGSGRQDAEFYRAMWDAILSGRVWNGRLENRRKSGEIYCEEMTVTPVLDAAGYVSHFIAVKSDVTESVRARSRLESLVQQKEELLREIHHRVKNNMQVIVSLLNVWSRDVDDPAVSAKIEDITRRMHAMSIIHEGFYVAEDITRIDFASFLRQLADAARAERPEGSRPRIEVLEADRALLNLEQAIPAGLIVAELLTNALKFAFADGRAAGRVRVVQKSEEDGRLGIEVRDDGVGLPEGLEPGTARSMGMMLIRVLSAQLNGEVEFRGEGGTSATLRFRIEGAAAASPGRGGSEDRP